MRPSVKVISVTPQVVPLNTYGKVGASILISGAGTLAVLANKDDVTSVISAGITTDTIGYPADAILVTNGVGQTLTIIQYGD